MTMPERENIRKIYAEWAKMKKSNKSMMSGSEPTETQKQVIMDRIDVEILRIDDLISSLEKLKEKLKTEEKQTEEYYDKKMSERVAKKL